MHIQKIINALLDNGDLFPFGVSGLLSLDTPTKIHRIIHALLQRFDSTDERFNILQTAMGLAQKSIFISIHELSAQAHEHDQSMDAYLPPKYRDLTLEQLNSLQKFVSLRISEWADKGQLDNYPYLLQVLTFWMTYGDQDACQQFIKQLTQTNEGLLSFLITIFDKAIKEAMTKYKKEEQWQVYLDNLRLFIDPALIENHAKEIFEANEFENLTEREQLALMIFLDLMHTKTTKIIPQTSP